MLHLPFKAPGSYSVKMVRTRTPSISIKAKPILNSLSSRLFLAL